MDCVCVGGGEVEAVVQPRQTTVQDDPYPRLPATMPRDSLITFRCPVYYHAHPTFHASVAVVVVFTDVSLGGLAVLANFQTLC